MTIGTYNNLPYHQIESQLQKNSQIYMYRLNELVQ